MSLIDEIERHYQGRRTEIQIPEWAALGCPETVYARPYTVSDDRFLQAYIDRNSSEAFAELVARKLEDADGKKIFHPADKVKLARFADKYILRRVADEITGEASSVEDAEGN